MKLKLLIMSILLFTCATVSDVEAASKLIDFELEIEMKNDDEYELEYEVKKDSIEAKYQIPGKTTVYGQEAIDQMKPFLGQLELSQSVNQVVLMNQILKVLKVDPKNVDEFELKVKFEDGKKLKIDR